MGRSATVGMRGKEGCFNVLFEPSNASALRRAQRTRAMDSVFDVCQEQVRGWYDSIGRLTAGVERLVWQGIPYLEAIRVSDPAVQAWLEPLYAARPRAGSVVAMVRTIEG